MAQSYSQRRTKRESEAMPDSARPIVVADPRAIVRGPGGGTIWMARCPRCSEPDDESIVSAAEDVARAECQRCGAIVEVRDSGIYRCAPTSPPPKE
jgi:hypothetical protein